MKKAVLVGLTMLLSGCVNVGPEYVAPDFDGPSKFVGGASDELREAASLAWWNSLGDPTLSEFVRIGLTQNLDVRTALERIVAARENTRLFGVANQLDGNASWDARRRDAGSGTTDDASLNADAFFVFDLFGENARGREQSLAELEAAEFEAGTVKLAFLTDVVTAYVQVRYFQQAAQITRETIASRRDTLNFARQRVDAQEGTQLEMAQAQSLLATAEASLPILTAQAKVNTFRIATLLNVPTGVVAQMLDGRTSIPNPKGEPAVGVPADLLRNRPDVRSAERQYAAATAAVGVSEAQLYPSLRLAGGISIGETDTWSFGPSVTFPIFDRNRRLASRDIARSNARQSELAYRQTYISAIEEVQTAMVLTRARHQQVTAYVQATSSAERVLNLARRSYEAGVVAIDEVLDADRTRLSNRLNLAGAQRDYALAWIQQQVSVGKGWSASGDAAVALASR